jgi:hypothetical protein
MSLKLALAVEGQRPQLCLVHAAVSLGLTRSSAQCCDVFLEQGKRQVLSGNETSLRAAWLSHG